MKWCAAEIAIVFWVVKWNHYLTTLAVVLFLDELTDYIQTFWNHVMKALYKDFMYLSWVSVMMSFLLILGWMASPLAFILPWDEVSKVVSHGLPHRQLWVINLSRFAMLWLNVDLNLWPSGDKAQSILLHCHIIPPVFSDIFWLPGTLASPNDSTFPCNLELYIYIYIIYNIIYILLFISVGVFC